MNQLFQFQVHRNIAPGERGGTSESFFEHNSALTQYTNIWRTLWERGPHGGFYFYTGTHTGRQARGTGMQKVTASAMIQFTQLFSPPVDL